LLIYETANIAIDYKAHLIFFEYIWTVQLHVYWRFDSNLSKYSYIHIFHLKHEKWSHLVFFCFCVFYPMYAYVYVCVQRDEDRWRQGWFICLESSFIWGVYYGDFHVSTQKEFICPSYFEMKKRKIIKTKMKIERRSVNHFLFFFISLILLIVVETLSLFCLVIHKAYSAETLTRNSLLTFFLVSSSFFSATTFFLLFLFSCKRVVSELKILLLLLWR